MIKSPAQVLRETMDAVAEAGRLLPHEVPPQAGDFDHGAEGNYDDPDEVVGIPMAWKDLPNGSYFKHIDFKDNCPDLCAKVSPNAWRVKDSVGGPNACFYPDLQVLRMPGMLRGYMDR